MLRGGVPGRVLVNGGGAGCGLFVIDDMRDTLREVSSMSRMAAGRWLAGGIGVGARGLRTRAPSARYAA